MRSILNALILIVVVLSVVQGDAHAQEGQPTKLYSIDHDGKNLQEIFDFKDTYSNMGSPSLSPKGDRIAFDATTAGNSGSDSHLMIFDLKSKEIKDLGRGAMPTWSKDGMSLAYSSYSPRGVFERTLDGNFQLEVNTSGWALRFSPSGNLHAYTLGSEFVVTNIETGEVRKFQPNPAAPYRQIYWNHCWSTDEQRIAFVGTRQDGKREVAIVDVWQDTPQSYVCFESNGWANHLAWRPNSEEIVLRRYKAPHQLFQFTAEPKAEPTPLGGQPKDRFNCGPTWSRDGKTLYFFSFLKAENQ